ncbi:MAG: 4Fe-4S binding protein [Bellilinea sp.]
MTGKGFVRMLVEVFKRFVLTYIEDFKIGKKRYYTPEGIEARRSSDVKGIFTIQYPEEKLPVPEEFRFLPFLLYDEGPNGEKDIRCTSCGICPKVCPPQCIWIVRTNDPVTGKPVPQPKEFYIDVDVCMNCGLCAEYCPFDAIKMDHDYEIASYNRMDNIYNIQRLLKPVSYYDSIRPTNNAAEIAARQEKEAQKAAAKRPTPGEAAG